MKLFWAGIFFVSVFVSIFAILVSNHAYATNGFEQVNWRLSHNPLICSFEPTPSKFDTVKKQTLLNEAEYSIIDWNQKVNEGLGKHPVWMLTHKIIPISEQYDSKFYSNCDVIIRYITSYSEDAVHYDLYKGGVTTFDYNTNKAYIKIFFSDMNQYELGNAIRHEIGHAMGLGHYDVAPDEQLRIDTGSEDTPSIMYPHMTVSNYYSINPVDVNEVKRIYGLDGFHLTNHVTVNSTIPLWIKNDAIDCCSTNRGSYIVDSVLLRDMTITGLIQSKDSVFQDGVDSAHSLGYQFVDHFKDYITEGWVNGTISDKQFLSRMQDLLDHGQLIK
jgi:hypothetical protein